MEFKDSETKRNLMRAFAGESQARNRYTFAAAQAKKEKQDVIQQIFLFTADQEKEHAEIFYNLLKEASGEEIHVDGSYPVDIYKTVIELLESAQHNELQESNDIYKNFGDTAKEEGFTQVADIFYKIADIEQTHGDRFGYYAQLLKEQKLYVSDCQVNWMCLNCGYIINSLNAPTICPVCKHEQGYFIRLSLAPYTE